MFNYSLLWCHFPTSPPDKLRLVRFYDTLQDRRFSFLTNQLLLQAVTISQLYKMRWHVELFFKWTKQHLRIKRFYGNSMNAVKTQIRIPLNLWCNRRTGYSCSIERRGLMLFYDYIYSAYDGHFMK